ncbi:Oligopeptide transport ATP-binding protein OppD [Devosia sp. LC5]|uniref:oligopeptide/dipeptide ABC transporter ATP-binding protein n=1 Tax=Devosia sp. LC5 TaxID=1502724 RepID=UPI0004E40352|nr:Oligopeptide transport ATP-binding protein OppD [Devosia sp. LC5]
MPLIPMLHELNAQSGPAPLDRDNLLTITGLRTNIPTAVGIVKALEGIDLVVPRGKTVCVVGESGSGKSMTARSILRLVPYPGNIVSGTIRFAAEPGKDVDITALERDGRQMRAIRGKQIAMIFQEPMSALSPIHTIGDQIVEMIRLHEDVSKAAAWQRGQDLLAEVGIPDPGQRMRAYTFQLSGGMRQRAMIAMALACNPRLLIADEPTTALDVTTQAQILQLLRRLRDGSGMSILFIAHDLGVVAEMADEVVVTYLGTIVERAERNRLFTTPRHPYRRALLRSNPELAPQSGRLATIRGMVPDPFNRPGGCPFHNRCDSFMPGLCDARVPPALDVDGTQVRCWLYSEESASFRHDAKEPVAVDLPALPASREVCEPVAAEPLIRVRGLSVLFPLRHGLFSRQSGYVQALDAVSFNIHRGEILGVVGESGCGKTTLGRSLIGTQKPSSGSITYLGGKEPFELAGRSDRQLREYRREVRMVFQDPFSSLDPRMTVGDIVSEPQRCPNVHGFYGASSMERLPTETAIEAQIRDFTAIRIDGPNLSKGEKK